MRIIVGVTGASGVIMSYHLLKALKNVPGCETHLIASRAAKTTWKWETEKPFSELTALADAVYDEDDLAAVIASGTFVTEGMIVLPCTDTSAVAPYLCSEKNTPFLLAKSSTTMNPALCLVPSYSAPIFPKPTTKYFISNRFSVRVL